MATTMNIDTVPIVQNHIVQVPQPTPEEHPAKRFKNAFLGVGITLIVFGVLSIILGGVSFSPSVMGTYSFYIASGLWGGAWYIASGALATATAMRPNQCNTVAGLVVSILTSLVAFGVGVVEAAIAGGCQLVDAFEASYCRDSFHGVHTALSLLAFLSFVLAIVHSSYCCCGGLCGASNYQGGAVVSTTVATIQHPVHMPYQQPVHIPYQQFHNTSGHYYPHIQQAQAPRHFQPAASQALPAQIDPPAYNTDQKRY